MSTDISLHELLELSIGTPDVGSVNFSALHTLLNAMLGHLKIERVTTSWREVDHDHGSPSQTKPLLLDKSSPYQVMEEKVLRMEEQISVLESLPSALELMRSDTAVSDMWTLMQLRRKAQGNEDGVSKCMALIQELLKEIQALKDSRDDLKKEVMVLYIQLGQLNMNELAEHIVAMEQYCHQVEDLDNATKELKEKLTQYPLPEELTQCVTWEVMQAALISERQKIQEGLKDTITLSAAKDVLADQPLNQGILFKNDTAGTPGVDTSHQVSLPQQSDGALSNVIGHRLSRVSTGAESYPETVEALMEVGRLRERHESLETRVRLLEANKADQSQLQHLSDLLNAMGERQIPDHIPEQLNYLRTLVDSLIADKEKVSELERVLINTGTEQESAGESAASDSSTDLHTSQIISHIRSAVVKLDAKVEGLMREKVNYRAEEGSSKDRHLQEQLNSLRLVIEDMMTSSSPFSKRQQQEPVMFSKDKGHVQGLDLAQGLIQGSFQFQGVGQAQGHVQGWVQGQGHIQGSVQDQGHVQGLGQDQGHVQGLGQVQSMCQTQGQSSGHVLSQSSDHVLDQSLDQSQCSGQDRGQDQHTDLQDQGQHQTEGQDLEQEISQLFQCFDKPESMITPLMDQEHDRCKNTELVTDVQGAILQLQAELKKLHSISSHLIEEHSKKQIHIDHLYKTMEELDEKKANKELVEMEIENKADKHALESKVSCMQFDSVTEQLNSMLQELLSKISGQEQDWNKIMEKISTEMDCKLNRIELDPLKKQLDDRWRSIHKQLQTPPAPEQDDAAGLRKHLVTLPSAPGLPTHKSNRPYTVYELEQVRQHCRSLTPGSNQDNFRMACVKRGMRQDQRSYTLMHRQIEQENSHFPTSKAPEHPYSQTLPELAWPRPRPTMSPLKKSSRKPSKHERIPEMADYSYLARSCGGSHTLTYPHRRYTRLQHITHLIQSEEESQPVSSGPPIQAEVVDILGMDGQVYKGRMSSRAVRTTESRLPTISPREGNCKSKDKVNCLPSQRSSGVDAGRGSPARPQSAKTQRSHSASSSSVRERPTSSMDNLSQGITLQSSFHDTTTEPKQGLEFNKDLSQSEDEPVTSL